MISELSERPWRFSIKLHSKIQASFHLDMSGGKFPSVTWSYQSMVAALHGPTNLWLLRYMVYQSKVVSMHLYILGAFFDIG